MSDTADTADSLVRAIAAAPELTPELAPGTVIDETFRVERRLGAGGMGEVYLAGDVRLHRQVAVKLQAGSAGNAERTAREAKVLARLSHPNVVTVYDVGVWRGRVFIAMEYLDGGTLGSWLEERPRRWREVLDQFLAAARGLAGAHDAGLVHRDFKPDNVLVGRDGRLRVADFGLARAAGEVAAEGEAAGTPGFMSPEAKRGAETDARSDQYSFCVALDRAMAAVRRPPRWIRRIVARGLDDDPARRWPSMRELIARLEGARRRRRVGRAGLLAAVVLAAALVAAWRLGARPDQRCTGAPAQMAGAWSPARAARVRAALAAAGAGPSGDAAVAALDRYAGSWAGMHRGACLSTRVRGEQTEHVLELRMACLDRARAQLAATGAILESADRTTAEHARDLVAALPSLGRCADVNALAAVRPPPESAAARAEARDIDDKLTQASVAWYAGRYDAAYRDLETLLARARALAWDPLFARVAFSYARVVGARGGDAQPLLREAVAAAIRGGDDEAAVKTLADLAWSVADLGRDGEARAWIETARALHARRPDDAELEAILLATEVEMARDREDIAAAEQMANRLVELAGRRTDPEAAYSLASARIGLAAIQILAGRMAEAKASMTQGLAQIEPLVGPDSPELQDALMQLALIHLRLGEMEEAAAAARRAAAAMRSSGAGDSIERLFSLGGILQQTGDKKGGLELLERALDVSRKGEASDGQLTAIHFNLALAYDDAGRRDEAAEHARLALAAAERAHPGDAGALALPRGVLSTIERELGHVDAAFSLASASLAGFESSGAPPQQVAEARYQLARVLWMKGERRRALALATQARDAYRALAPAFAAQLGEIEAWLRDPR